MRFILIHILANIYCEQMVQCFTHRYQGCTLTHAAENIERCRAILALQLKADMLQFLEIS